MLVENLCIVLGSCLDRERFFAKNRDFDRFLSSKCCFCRSNIHGKMEIIPLTYESSFSIRKIESSIEITTTISTSMSLTSDLDTHTVLDASRDFDILFHSRFLPSFSMTGSTLLTDNFSTS